MDHPEINRRDFNRLTAAAFGGVLAGTMAGCGGDDEKKPMSSGTTPGVGKNEPAKPDDKEVATAKGDPHACRGLNACKGQGRTARTTARDKGDCATASWHHSCGSDHACKGQGGCGDNPTQNECKGKGGCHIPLMDSAWEKARKFFEEKMTAADKKFGAGTPPKKK